MIYAIGQKEIRKMFAYKLSHCRYGLKMAIHELNKALRSDE